MNHSDVGRRRRTFIWTTTAIELAIANTKATGPQRKQLVTQLSQLTNNPRPACRRFIERMGNKAKIPYKKWFPKDQERLLELLDKYTVSEVSRQMRCSRRSIYAVLRRLKIGARMRQDSFSKSRLAAVLHVRFYAVDSWIRNGWLNPTVIQIGQVRRTVIKPDDFVQFCLEYREVVIGNRLNAERLEFVYKYIFPPDHNHLLSVRESKKEREAFRRSRSIDSEHEDAKCALWESEGERLNTAICIHGESEIAVAKADAALVMTQDERHLQDRTGADTWESACTVLPMANCGIPARPGGP